MIVLTRHESYDLSYIHEIIIISNYILNTREKIKPRVFYDLLTMRGIARDILRS